MHRHPDAVMPPGAKSPAPSRIDATAHERDDATARLRARLLKMIVDNEKLRKTQGDTTRPR